MYEAQRVSFTAGPMNNNSHLTSLWLISVRTGHPKFAYNLATIRCFLNSFQHILTTFNKKYFLQLIREEPLSEPIPFSVYTSIIALDKSPKSSKTISKTTHHLEQLDLKS